MTSHDISITQEKIVAHKKELSQLLQVKKIIRDHHRIADLQNRISTLKSWMKENPPLKKVDQKAQLKIETRKQMIARRRADFEEMLIEIDKDPTSGKTILFKSKDDVDSVIDLIHREIVLRNPPRTNLEFAGTPTLINYIRQLVHKRIKGQSMHKATQVGKRLQETVEKEIKETP